MRDREGKIYKIGLQNIVERGLVWGKGFRVAAAHHHP